MKFTPQLAGRAVMPLMAASAIGFAIVTAQRPDPALGQPAAPPPAPSAELASAVAAVGLVEPASEVIAVAAETGGVVREVLVRPGDTVKAGAPLFRLDARVLETELASARATLRIAEVEARDAEARKRLFTEVDDARAVSLDERDRASFGAERALANVQFARAEIARLQAELARLTVRAPIDGQVLRVNVRAGEFASAGPVTDPLIAMGDTSRLHVRVQIDEEDVTRIEAGARAEGSLRGDAGTKAPLTFVRFEPQARAKQNLTGGAERVDTRVIEAIYALDPKALPAFVGQQMDVFIAATPIASGARASRAGQRG